MNEGKKGKDIFKEIKSEGFQGSYRTVQNFIKKYRRKKTEEYSYKEAGYETKRIPRKRIMSLLFRYPEELKGKQKEELKKITENKELNILYKLVQRFRRLIGKRELSSLDIWLDDALCSGIKELKVFAEGLQNNIQPVKNALKYDYNNGIVEGNINRLKTIKRTMYGRAGYDLISKKVLYSFR